MLGIQSWHSVVRFSCYGLVAANLVNMVSAITFCSWDWLSRDLVTKDSLSKDSNIGFSCEILVIRDSVTKV